MANIFKNKTKKNISTEFFLFDDNGDGVDLGDNLILESGTTSDSGSILAIQTYSNTTIYTCPDDTTSIIVSLSLINKINETINVYLFLNSDTSETKLVNGSNITETNENITIFNNVPIPPFTTLEISSGQKYVLKPNDSIVARTDSTSGLDTFVSMLEIN